MKDKTLPPLNFLLVMRRLKPPRIAMPLKSSSGEPARLQRLKSSGRLPDHHHADSDDDQWPYRIEVDVRDTEIFKNQQNSRGQQNAAEQSSPPVAAAIKDHCATGGDHNHRPEIT